MFMQDLFEYGIPKGEIQGELLSAMMDATDDLVHIHWEEMKNTEGYALMAYDNNFEQNMQRIFNKYLGVNMEETITASTVKNDKDSIFKIISYLQKNTNEQQGIKPSSIGINIDNYEIKQASVFNWRGARFLVIKDSVGIPSGNGVVGNAQTHYHIYAASDTR